MAAPGGDRARLFFALWPDEGVRQALHRASGQLHGDWDGRRVPAQNLHMTLAFLGDVDVARLPDLMAAAGTVRGQRFSLSMTRLGGWRRNGIAWAGPAEASAPLDALVQALREALKAAGFQFDEKGFAAHVTLLRKSRPHGGERTMEPARWAVEDFVLVRSRLGEGAAYEVIGRFPLDEATPA